MTEYGDEVDLARRAAEEAGAIQRDFLTRGRVVQIKDDGSPVTEVDRTCESLIRTAIARQFPQDGFLGEETGAIPGSSGRSWIVDPLDGTRPYLRGIPTYSVLIALEDRGTPVVGVMHFAGLGQTYWASRGNGAVCNGEAVRVSQENDMRRSLCSALGFVEKADQEEGRRLLSLMRHWDYCYGFMDAYSYACVASGRLDACVNILDKPWDCAAAACIVSEAGGAFSDIKGRMSVHNNSIVLTNGILHNEIVQWFS